MTPPDRIIAETRKGSVMATGTESTVACFEATVTYNVKPILGNHGVSEPFGRSGATLAGFSTADSSQHPGVDVAPLPIRNTPQDGFRRELCLICKTLIQTISRVPLSRPVLNTHFYPETLHPAPFIRNTAAPTLSFPSRGLRLPSLPRQRTR